MEKKWFMHRIKCENDVWDKGIEVHPTLEKATGSFHAYLGTYGYGNPKFPNVQYVACMVTDMDNFIELKGGWKKPEE